MRRMLVALCCASLLSLAQLSAEAAPPPVEVRSKVLSDSARASGKLRLTLNLPSCPECSLKIQGDATDWESWWTSNWKVVGPDGRVSFRIKRSRADTISVSIQAPWSSVNYEHLVVARYKGTRLGEKVGRSEALAAKRATACWAGPTRKRTKIRIRVLTYPTTTVMGETTTGLSAWFKAAKHRAPGSTWQRTYRGGLGTQEPAFCS